VIRRKIFVPHDESTITPSMGVIEEACRNRDHDGDGEQKSFYF